MMSYQRNNFDIRTDSDNEDDSSYKSGSSSSTDYSSDSNSDVIQPTSDGNYGETHDWLPNSEIPRNQHEHKGPVDDASSNASSDEFIPRESVISESSDSSESISSSGESSDSDPGSSDEDGEDEHKSDNHVDETGEGPDETSNDDAIPVPTAHEEQIDITSFMSKEEEARAKTVFYHVAERSESADVGINEEECSLALALLGQRETTETLRKAFSRYKLEYIDFDAFKLLLARLRNKEGRSDLTANIKEAFNALYDGTCEFDDQRDEFGEKFIYAKALRNVLITHGNKLTDEEADELIRECRPVVDRTNDGGAIHKIYYEQYRSMLLDKST